jgi:hypothetical protein
LERRPGRLLAFIFLVPFGMGALSIYIYEPEQLNETPIGCTYIHFKLTTSFNFYASWWAGWIMKDVQENILQIIKERAEHTH